MPASRGTEMSASFVVERVATIGSWLTVLGSIVFDGPVGWLKERVSAHVVSRRPPDSRICRENSAAFGAELWRCRSWGWDSNTRGRSSSASGSKSAGWASCVRTAMRAARPRDTAAAGVGVRQRAVSRSMSRRCCRQARRVSRAAVVGRRCRCGLLKVRCPPMSGAGWRGASSRQYAVRSTSSHPVSCVEGMRCFT